MAGICTGLGLDTDADGLLTIDGARKIGWPNESVCPINGNNGLKVDPATGNAWVAPDPDFAGQSATGEDISITPQTTNIRELTEFSWTRRARKCTRSLFLGTLGGGYAQARVGTGNFWVLKRTMSIALEGTPIGFTGTLALATYENNSGGVMTTGAVADCYPFQIQVPAGQELKITVHYQLDPATYLANALNNFTWRSPSITGAFLSYP